MTHPTPDPGHASGTGLSRQLGLLPLTATGICSMIGASIYIVPFMIQRNIPGIGPYVVQAFLLAALPAVLAAFAYAILATAMPRAGGSYLYASRGLHPYLGFVASFSQWFGVSIGIGVISYMIVPFLRDIATVLQWSTLAATLDNGWLRVVLALAILWLFVWINFLGLRSYERALIPLMVLMFGLGAIVIAVGFTTGQDEFIAAVMAKEGRRIELAAPPPLPWNVLLSASALLFSSFIGFDSIAQAGGEARNPGRSLPLAIGLSVATVGIFYLLFSAAVYHVVPWSFVAGQAMAKDTSAPGLLSYLLPAGWAAAILAGAAVALTNDIPAMLLSVSRLMFAWAEDGIFPRQVGRIHPRHHTPYIALLVSGLTASAAIFGSHFAGDFFLGVDILVTSMLVNFLLICLSVITLPKRNPALASAIKVLKSRPLQLALGISGVLILSGFLAVHLIKDMSARTEAWYFHSTPVWVIVMAIASLVFFREWRQLKKRGVETGELFSKLPPE